MVLKKILVKHRVDLQLRNKGTTRPLRFTNNWAFFFDIFFELKMLSKSVAALTLSRLLALGIAGASSVLPSLLQRCSVAVLLRVFPYSKNTSIFIYKYRVNFWLSYNLFWNCNTATTATHKLSYRLLWIFSNIHTKMWFDTYNWKTFRNFVL